MIARLASLRSGIAFIGLLLAGYLLAVHFQGGHVACPTGGCEQVQASPYSLIFGVPLPAFGVASWLTLLVLAVLGGSIERLVEVSVSVCAAVFAVYLLAVQTFVLHHFCLWCIGNDLLALLFCGLVLAGTRPANS